MKRAVIFILCCMMAVWLLGCTGEDAVETFDEGGESGMRRTVLYLATEDGYVVPIMKRIPWEEGIGKAALSYLVSGEDNDRSASAMGLKTVIPEGTGYTLRIGDDKEATLDLMGCPPHETLAEEQAMVVAIVNTLSEFDSIDRVKITLDGASKDALPMGTDISEAMEKFELNTEEGELPASGRANKLTLYFPNISASLNIPVTRYIDRAPSFAVALQELIAGTDDGRLLNCFPQGTELNSAYIYEGIATVDLSRAFDDAGYLEGGLEAARDAIYLCANEFEEVYGVDIYVEGQEYSLHTAAAAAPVYVNEFR
ncbi:MAG: GerMN domain-containing protein [Clostridia bacterium]|nr:GerMN domain-containing protein [Clostridia bacterium]